MTSGTCASATEREGGRRLKSQQKARSRAALETAGQVPILADRGDESFTACLNRHLRRSGLSLSALARCSWLDIGYVSRLVNLPCDPLNPRLDDHVDKRRPSRDTVIRLGLAMHLAMEDMDELLLVAGYAPLVR